MNVCQPEERRSEVYESSDPPRARGLLTQDNNIAPTMCGWSDDGSGLAVYHVEVYYMQSGTDNKLTELAEPEISQEVGPTQNNFRFRCTVPGVYSIQLTVRDQAGNVARARKLFNYDDTSELNSKFN
jgi:hypothetical protein